MYGMITDIQRFSLNDGPGIRTTVFLKGCNLHCAWCHNPETIRKKNELMVYPANCIGCGHCVPVCPSGARSIAAGVLQFDRTRCTACGASAAVCFPGALKMAGRSVSVAEVMGEILQDRAYYADSGGGVTLSGGELFCQAEFADALIDACREEKIPVAVETNLNWQFESVRPILEKLDLIMFDVKIFDSVEHKRWTGVENAELLDNAVQNLAERPGVFRLKVVVTPVVRFSAVREKIEYQNGNIRMLLRDGFQQIFHSAGEFSGGDFFKQIHSRFKNDAVKPFF